jgi:hypothetical protein
LNERYRPADSTTITRVEVQNPAIDLGGAGRLFSGISACS